MTIITVTTPAGRLNVEQRRKLSQTLTDAVLVPEVGQEAPAARIGFQVHFVELAADAMAIGGVLLSDQQKPADVVRIDVAVMDAAWPHEVRAKVIANIFAAMAAACGLPAPAPTWWVTFHIIEEGSWGSRGAALSILDLLESGVFTSARVAAIRAAIRSDVRPTAQSDEWRYPYGSSQRYHMQHTHLFASDVDATIDFYSKWFDAKVTWDGDVAGARNVFMKIGIGALHLYDQLPRGSGKNAVHHLGMQVVGLSELHERMQAAGLHIPNPIRPLGGGGGYFMLGAPDGVVIEVFEPGVLREPAVRDYYGFAG